MDAETIRLTVVAAGAVTAGLGGAMIAGFFGRTAAIRSAAEARQAQEEKSRQTRQLEHLQWLRNQKQIAYQRFLLDIGVFRDSIWPVSGPQPSLKSILTAREHLHIVGSNAVRQKAIKVTTAAKTLLAQRDAIRNPPENSPERLSDEIEIYLLESLDDHLKWAVSAFLEEVRSDLGSGPEDDPIDGVSPELIEMISDASERKNPLYQFRTDGEDL